MIINNITKSLIYVVTILITPLKWLMIVPTYLLFNTPLIKVIYELIIVAVWFPFGAFISVMSAVYKSVPIVGFLLAFIGIPIVLLGYAISYLLSPRGQEERVFIEASQSYPSVGDVI